jgi:hypothetical protein
MSAGDEDGGVDLNETCVLNIGEYGALNDQITSDVDGVGSIAGDAAATVRTDKSLKKAADRNTGCIYVNAGK